MDVIFRDRGHRINDHLQHRDPNFRVESFPGSSHERLGKHRQVASNDTPQGLPESGFLVVIAR